MQHGGHDDWRAALERSQDPSAALLRQLRTHEAEKARLGDALAAITAELRASRESSHRLFEALCRSLPGRALGGRFEVLHRLGAGGHGVVFHALDRRTHRDVALKLLRTAEPCPCAPRLVHLSHPNITALLETGTLIAGIPFVAMELLRGGDLGEVLARQQSRGRTLRVDQAVRIAQEVCSGLAEAHRWDLVHRDIKPSNVFLARQRTGPRVKLLDFGLARVVRTPELDGGAIPGTPSYVAPERLEREPYDWRVDIYAVGVLLYELLGVPLRPQAAGQAAGQWEVRWSEEPPALHTLRSDVPRGLSELASRAISRDPGRRPRAEELARGLAEWAAPLHGLGALLAWRGVAPSASTEQTLESLEPQSLGELDTQPQLPEPAALQREALRPAPPRTDAAEPEATWRACPSSAHEPRRTPPPNQRLP